MQWAQKDKSLVAEFSKGNSITVTPKYAGDAPTREWYVSITVFDTDTIINKTVFGSSVDDAIRFAERRAQALGWFYEQ